MINHELYNTYVIIYHSFWLMKSDLLFEMFFKNNQG